MVKLNLVLIGMPGAGKSTVGVLAAKALGLSFVDTDLIIQQREGRLLRDIITQDGIKRFLAIEEAAITALCAENTIIATGGSVIYSRQSMQHLQTHGLIVYLDVPLQELEKRIRNMAARGIVMGNNQQLSDLYRERIPLYRDCAGMTVSCADKNVEEVVQEIYCIYTKQMAERRKGRGNDSQSHS